MSDYSMFEPRLVEALHLEAMVLTDEARSYFDVEGREERESLTARGRAEFERAALQVTAKLLHIVQRLLHRLPSPESIVAQREPASPVELPEEPALDLELLPERAREIALATEDLYERVSALELRLEIGPPTDSPARALLEKLQSSL